MAFHTVYAVIPLFLRELGAPNGIAVSVGGLFFVLIAIPQLIVAVLGRNVQKLKPAVILVHTLVWFPLFLMGFIFTFVLPEGKMGWIIYMVLFSIYGLGLGVVVPIWVDFLNAVTLREKRGTFFGLSFALGGLGSFFGGAILTIILNSSLVFPKNFGVGFFIFSFSTVVATVVYFGYKVDESRKKQSLRSLGEFLILTKTIITGHHNFQKYILSRFFYCASFPAISLYAIYCQEKFGFNISEAGTFTMINVFAAGVASYVSGSVGQKYGHKYGMIISYSAHLIAAILAVFSQNMIWVYSIFLCIGISAGAFMPSAMNLVYDFSGDRENKLYMALIDTFLAPVTVIFLLIASFLTEWGYFLTAIIGIGGCLLVSLIILIFFVRDPRENSELFANN